MNLRLRGRAPFVVCNQVKLFTKANAFKPGLGLLIYTKISVTKLAPKAEVKRCLCSAWRAEGYALSESLTFLVLDPYKRTLHEPLWYKICS